MLESLVNWCMLFLAFKTPYPYLLILTVLLGILLYSIAFVHIKNSWAGALSVWAMLCILVMGFMNVGQMMIQPDEDSVTDKTHQVVGISPQGLQLSSGDVVVPAGTRFVKRLSRHYKSMEAALKELTDGKRVRCEAAPGGYAVITEDEIDVAEYLVERGLVYTNEHATSRLKALEETAKQQRQGLWVGGWRAGPQRQGGIWTSLWAAFTLAVHGTAVCVGYMTLGALAAAALQPEEVPKKKKK